MRLRLLLKTTVLTALFITFFNVGWGQALLVEDFDYTTGTFLNANGWNAHSGGGTTPIQVVTPGLTFTDYAGSGIGNAAGVNNTGEDVHRTFPEVTSGTVYAAMIVQSSAPNVAGYFAHLGQTTIGTTFFSRAWINATGDGIGIGSTAPATYVPITPGTPTLVVLKLDYTSKISSLFVLSSFTASEPGVADQTFTETANYTNVGSIALRQFNAAERVIVDGIRVATSWEEAVKANTPPMAAFNPVDGSTTANPDDNIVITFDEAALNIDGSPVADPTSLITLKETDGSGADVAFTATINDGKTEITIDPAVILDYNKIYYVAVAPVEDIAGKESVLQSAIFTTRAQDVVAPLWTTDYPNVSAINNSDFNLLVSLDEIGKAYFVVLPDGATAPTPAQVKAGLDASDIAALKSGSINILTAATEFSTNISGLTAGTVYDVYVVAEDVEITPNLQSVVALVPNVATTDTKPEPTNQASGFSVAVNNQTSLTFSWTDAVGDQLPAGYLILVNETGTFTDPVDGITQPNDASAVNVAYGAGTKQLTGLVAGTHYYFAIYSYTNSGTAIDYLLTSPPATDVSLPALAITYPNGGETFYAGDTTDLTWNSTHVTDVIIEVSFDNGTLWQPWLGPITSDGAETVIVPADAGYSNQYLLRISDAVNANINDATDAAFTVKAVTGNLVDLLSMPVNSIVKYTGKATITYARTARNQKYIQDETAAVLIDDPTTAPGFITGTYAIGDGITNIEGKVLLYGGLVEFTPIATTGEPVTGNPVIVPEVRTIESLTHADQCKLVKIENFSFATTGEYAVSSAFVASRNYTVSGYLPTVFAYRTLFAESDYIGTEIPLAPITAICIVGEFNGLMQITARNFADIKFTQADVTSTVYTVDFANSVIKDIPEADDLATFKGNLIPAAGATFNVFDADGVTPATVLNNSKLVIATAQDGTTTKTYTIEITVYVPSTVATLSKLSVNGASINGFLSGTLNYAVLLPVGTSAVPEVTYILTDDKATAVVTNATDLFGTETERTTKVVLTAEDGTSEKTYSIVFTVDNTGIANNGAAKLRIYPVPVIDEITITGLARVNRLEIMDVTGKIIRKVKITGEEVTLNISDLHKGMYFLRSESQILKFVKK